MKRITWLMVLGVVASLYGAAAAQEAGLSEATIEAIRSEFQMDAATRAMRKYTHSFSAMSRWSRSSIRFLGSLPSAASPSGGKPPPPSITLTCPPGDYLAKFGGTFLLDTAGLRNK